MFLGICLVILKLPFIYTRDEKISKYSSENESQFSWGERNGKYKKKEGKNATYGARLELEVSV